MKKKFIVVSSSSKEVFEERVNEELEQGYILYGNPMFQMVSSSSTWRGNLRNNIEQKYAQCLILKNE